MKGEEVKNQPLKNTTTLPKQKSESESMQSVETFVKEYKALCEKHQLRIVTNPAFKARDDGTWSLVLQSSVGRLPKKVV